MAKAVAAPASGHVLGKWLTQRLEFRVKWFSRRGLGLLHRFVLDQEMHQLLTSPTSIAGLLSSIAD